MILLPIGHEAGTVRRLPWVTFTLMALCVVGFIVSGRAELQPRDDLRVARDGQRALQYYLEHPYLELDPEFSELAFPDEEQAEAWRSAMAVDVRPPDNGMVRFDEQARLDQLTQRALRSYHGHALQSFGLVPDAPRPAAFITHMFLHGGWLHLLGNLLILYLAGPFVEDVWGRPLFGAFYVAAGLFAALTYIGSNPDSTVPMIGASGAISGVMGAFLVRYRKTRIRFFYLVGLFWRGTFAAPAWVMLPLWFVQQLFFAVLFKDALADAGGGVAHWAHIGGFVFGAGFAALLAGQRIEERFLEPRLKARAGTPLLDRRGLDEALEARAAGNVTDAFERLAGLVGRDPTDEDAAVALLDLAREAGLQRRATPLLLRHVEALLRVGRHDDALRVWFELDAAPDDAAVDPALLVRIARACIDRGRTDEARVILRRALLGGGRPPQGALALSIGRLAEAVDPVLARGAARLALESGALDPDLERRARALEQRSRSAPAAADV